MAHGHLTLAAVQSGSSTYHHGTQDVNNHWFLGRFYQMEITTRFLRRLRRMRGENMYTFPGASRKPGNVQDGALILGNLQIAEGEGILPAGPTNKTCAATASREIVCLRCWQSQCYYSPSPPPQPNRTQTLKRDLVLTVALVLSKYKPCVTP